MSRRSLGVLTLDLIAKIGGFKSGMDQAARIADDRTRRMQRSFSNLRNGVAGVFAAIGGGLAVKAIIDATIEQERVLKQLETTIKSTGGVAGFSADQLSAFATDLQKVTTYGDEAIVAMEAVLLTFTQIRGDQFKGATEAVLDLSTALGTDLQSAALLVGKALNDPVKGASALSRAGIQLTAEQKELIKTLVETNDVAGAQAIILKELGVQFGGSARAAADTFGGSIQQLKNAFGDLLEGNGGVTDAKEGVQALTAVLQDPSTVAAAQTLTNGIITAFSAATQAILGTVNVAKFVGEEIASIQFGAAADDLVRLDEELSLRLDQLAGNTSRVRFLGKGGIIEYWDDAELKAEIARLKGLLAEGFATAPPVARQAGLTAGTPTTPGGGPPTPPSEDFLKLEEKLQQQIALYGKTGEAAKLAYDIQSGAIEGLSTAEGERLVSLAQQYDALVRNTEAAKAQAAEQQKVSDAFAAQEETYIKQLALVGEVTELEQLRYEIGRGALAGITAEQAAYLEALAAQVEAVNATIEAEREKEAVMAEGAAIYEATRTPLEKYVNELMRLKELYEGGALDPETFLRATEEAREAFEANATESNEFLIQASRNVQGIIADNLINGFEDGAKGMLSAFANMLRDMAAQALAAKLAELIFGSGGVGSGGGWVGLALSAFGGSRDSGGRGEPGTAYAIGVGAQPEMFVPDRPGTFIPNFDSYMSQPQVTVSPQIINVRDPSEIPTALQSGQGEQAIINVIARNPSVIRTLLQG